MSKAIQIIPAILSESIGDYVRLVKEFEKFSEVVHIDVMDGIYVQTKSPSVEEILRNIFGSKIRKNFHLMMEHPVSVLNHLFQDETVDIIYIHANSTSREECRDILQRFEDKKQRFAFVFNKDDDISTYRDFLNKVEIVQLMTVAPGRQASEFDQQALENISRLLSFDYKGEIHIDGGVNQITLEQILYYHPDVLNVGSAIARSSNPHSAYYELVSLVSSKFKFVD